MACCRQANSPASGERPGAAPPGYVVSLPGMTRVCNLSPSVGVTSGPGQKYEGPTPLKSGAGRMRRITPQLTAFFVLVPALACSEGAPFDAAAAFGARPSVIDLRLSPDGQSLAWIGPAAGQGAVVYTLSLAKDAKPKAALSASGAPERI